MRPVLPSNLVDESIAAKNRVTAVEKAVVPGQPGKYFVELSAFGFGGTQPTGEMRSNVIRPYSSLTVKEIVVEVGAPGSRDTTVRLFVGEDQQLSATVPAGKSRCGDILDEPVVLPATEPIQFVADDVDETETEWMSVRLLCESPTTHSVSLTMAPQDTVDPGEDVDPGPLRIGSVFDIAVDDDGKYVVVGSFSSACQQPVSNVARINPDGTLDTTFNTGAFPQPGLNQVVIQPDGKLLLGNTAWFAERFVTWGDRDYRGIVRVNADGSLDETWMPDGNPPLSIRAWTLLPNGKILVTTLPAFSNNYSRFALLSSEGVFEQHISPGDTASLPIQELNQELNFAKSISANEVLVWGANTTKFGGFGKWNIQTGAFERIRVGDGNRSRFGSIQIHQASPKQLLNGSWVVPTSYLGDVLPGGVLRVADNLSSWELLDAYAVETLALNLDIDQAGRIVLAGTQIMLNGEYAGSVVRMDAAGVLDTTFDTSSAISQQPGFNQPSTSRVFKVIVLPDSKILAVGVFDTPLVEGRVSRRNFIRLNSNGSLDQTFPAI